MTQQPRPLPLREALARAQARLVVAGVDSPAHDVRALVAHVLGASFGQLALIESLGPDQAAAFDAAVRRRESREPLQHITGEAGFRRLNLAVGPGTLVPRPETEVLTGWCVAALASDQIAAPVVADLGAGSGAIACAIADEVPGAAVHAVEVSDDAMPWLVRNAAPYPNVVVHHGDLAEAPSSLAGALDLVVSNPPYVPDGGAGLPPEVRDHDPGLALWGGPDGLDVIRAVVRAAIALLRPGGRCAIEHGDDQQQRVMALFGVGWADVTGHRDLTGRDRFVTARRAVEE